MTDRLPPFIRAVAFAVLAAASVVALAVVPERWTPKPGEYVWQPAVAPSGPLVIVVNLPLQQLHVYRNGVRIGASSISSGKPGHETPVGLFTILQKEAEHYSNVYDNAPMPWMQRLTWDGVALHAGRLPGHPASHGCIRLPDAFAKALFATTRAGDVVIVTDQANQPGIAASTGLLRALGKGSELPSEGDYWLPAQAPDGPVSVVVSTSDRRLVVTRAGRRIGQAAVTVAPGLSIGTHAYVLLEGQGEGRNPVLPERPARRWMAIDLMNAGDDEHVVRAAIEDGRLTVPKRVAMEIDTLLRPGATVVLTDEPIGDEVQRQQIDVETVVPPAS